jgi:hypothetical protein
MPRAVVACQRQSPMPGDESRAGLIDAADASSNRAQEPLQWQPDCAAFWSAHPSPEVRERAAQRGVPVVHRPPRADLMLAGEW